MCGRFVATTAPSRLALLFGASLHNVADDDFRENYNVAPTTQILMLRTHEQARVLQKAHWGLLPAWTKDRTRAASMINARSETLTEKPSFRPLLKSHRCVVPVDGYYEWRTVDVDASVKQPKQPYFIRSQDQRPLAIAGLWTTWRDPQRDSQEVHSCCIITISPNSRLAQIHDRMPCILDGDNIDTWLTAETPPLEVLQTANDDRVAAFTVSTAVNNVRNTGAALIEPTTTTLF